MVAPCFGAYFMNINEIENRLFQPNGNNHFSLGIDPYLMAG